MDNLTHLKTSLVFLRKQDQIQSRLVLDKFIESCLSLDASIFEPYMGEDDMFEDLEKYKFLQELKDLFDYSKFKTHSSFSVTLTNEKCMRCDEGKPVLNFEVRFRKSNLLAGDFGFLIDMNKGVLKDIYRCNMYKECHGVLLQPKGLPAIRVPNVGNKKFNVENNLAS